MKIRYIFLTIAAALIAGCSDDLDKGGAYNPEEGVIATIPSYSFYNGTRVNISDDLQTFTWSDNDKLGIYFSDSSADAEAGFKIKQGGSSTGVFSNDIFYLNPEKTYYAFYPYNSDFSTTSAEVDFTGQTQTGNASAAHLGAYNYMYGSVNLNSSGGASVTFKNLGSVMQLQITVSNAATYTCIDITSDGTKFITKGKANMANGNITATETSASIHLDFESGITLNEGDVLTANILVAPVDMSGSALTFNLIDEIGNSLEFTVEGKKMLAGMAYLYDLNEGTYVIKDETPYVTFSADAKQSFKMNKDVSTLEYSLNGGNWTKLGTTIVYFGGAKGDLRLRGKAINGTNGATISLGYTAKVACSGDIRTLMNYEFYDFLTKSGDFHNLFADCSYLISAPELPGTDLAVDCYRRMFDGCTSLTQAPKLPATKLTPHCYLDMFSGCTSLTQTPELPATNLADSCYVGMFSGCKSLIKAPKLPATKLTPYCYQQMFFGCTSLAKAPELPATTIALMCYNSMFQGCTSLTQAPTLPATTLAERCYQQMFYGCTSLIQAPELPATTLAKACYSYMFRNCTSLFFAPEILPAKTLEESCYAEMFQFCSLLPKAPILPATTLVKTCYSHMFQGCSNLTYVKSMALGRSAERCLDCWLSGVNSTGTFVKNSRATLWTNGDTSDDIPLYWSIETADE